MFPPKFILELRGEHSPELIVSRELAAATLCHLTLLQPAQANFKLLPRNFALAASTNFGSPNTL